MNGQYIVVGLILLLPGLALFYGAVMNSDWLFAMRRSQLWVRLLGRTGAQIAFGVIGFATLFGGGFLSVAGLLDAPLEIVPQATVAAGVGRLAENYAPPTPSALGFFDGGIRYARRVMYLSPPPPGYVSQAPDRLRDVMTYEQFAAHQGGMNWGDYATGSMQTNDDILTLVAQAQGFSSGWVIIVAPPFSYRYVEHEFFDVVSPTDWKIGRVTERVRADPD
ncbi:MAG: immunity 17 family protein [Chloroflexi bacterium]|nr:immunity 17 family protein [Chloroflexota bacterium]